MELRTVQGSNDRPGVFIGHFHKAKAAALMRLPVKSNAGADDLAKRFHEFGQVGRGGGKRQVAKIQYFAHILVYPCWQCTQFTPDVQAVTIASSRPAGCLT